MAVSILRLVCFFGCLNVLKASETEIFIRDPNYEVTNCNVTEVKLWVSNVTISPIPVYMGQECTFGFIIELLDSITTEKIEVDLSLLVLVGDEYKELCILFPDRACLVTDLCYYLKVHDLKCPTKMGKSSINVSNMTIVLPELDFRLKGRFKITVNFRQYGRALGCLMASFCITDC